MCYTSFKYCSILFLLPVALLGLLALTNCGGGGGGSGSASSEKTGPIAPSEYPSSLSFKAGTWESADKDDDIALNLENKVEFDHDGNDDTPPIFYYLLEPPSNAHHDDLDALLNGGIDTVDTDKEGDDTHDDDARSAVISITDDDSGETIAWTLILPTVAEFEALRAGHSDRAPLVWDPNPGEPGDAAFECWTSTPTEGVPDSHKVFQFQGGFSNTVRDSGDALPGQAKVVFQVVGVRTE